MKGFFQLFRKNKSALNPAWKKYQQLNGNQLPKNTPIEELEFAVIDSETTGLDIKKDELISIAGIMVKNNEIFINTGFEYIIKTWQNGRKSVPIHGILPGRVAKGEEEKEVMEALLEFLGNRVLVGHHAQFDVRMINKLLKRNFQGKILNQVIDTSQLAFRLENLTRHQPFVNFETFSLDHLCKTYNIPMEDRHTASGDVFLTAQLLLKLLSKAKKKGITSLGKLLKRNF